MIERPALAIAPATGMASVTTVPAFAVDEPQLIESRAVTEEFGNRLRSALQPAMAEGGPVAAIEVCKEIAPQIASELSRRTGAQVSRPRLRICYEPGDVRGAFSTVWPAGHQ
jgi:hypothetical protein